jgi:hypothetical protein
MPPNRRRDDDYDDDDYDRPRRKKKAKSSGLALIAIPLIGFCVLLAGGMVAVVWYVTKEKEVVQAPPPNPPAFAGQPKARPAEPVAPNLTPPAPAPKAAPKSSPNPGKPTGKVGLNVWDTAQEIDGEDVDGKRFKLSDYRGKVVVLDFWGDW